ncbi:hypothetical protein MATL_G00083840 [Megalops atlanticus]|uniref:Uncharacterized protein n=1 Tax=Megalops atlanticus TaxID=7932 RepID=A0A9D3T755_MEGAT|nr:hypothetical protein MATL_G00083840 [Megalops atlanticus]
MEEPRESEEGGKLLGLSEPSRGLTDVLNAPRRTVHGAETARPERKSRRNPSTSDQQRSGAGSALFLRRVFHWHACDRMKPPSRSLRPCHSPTPLTSSPRWHFPLPHPSYPAFVGMVLLVQADSCGDGQTPGVAAGGQQWAERDRSRPRQAGGRRRSWVRSCYASSGDVSPLCW